MQSGNLSSMQQPRVAPANMLFEAISRYGSGEGRIYRSGTTHGLLGGAHEGLPGASSDVSPELMNAMAATR